MLLMLFVVVGLDVDGVVGVVGVAVGACYVGVVGCC